MGILLFHSDFCGYQPLNFLPTLLYASHNNPTSVVNQTPGEPPPSPVYCFIPGSPTWQQCGYDLLPERAPSRVINGYKHNKCTARNMSEKKTEHPGPLKIIYLPKTQTVNYKKVQWIDIWKSSKNLVSKKKRKKRRVVGYIRTPLKCCRRPQWLGWKVETQKHVVNLQTCTGLRQPCVWVVRHASAFRYGLHPKLLPWAAG